MKIVVIGGSGFIGTRLVDVLIEQGHEVKIFDIQKSQKYPDVTILGDVRDVNALSVACANADLLYNLAAEHRDDVSPQSLYTEVNIDGARNIVAAAVSNNITKIVFTSTVAIYGLNKVCPDETFPAEPFNEYGRTKWEAEKIFKQWHSASTNRDLIIFRPAVVFGEGNRGNVYNLMAQIKSGRFIMVGNGKNKKSMGYVGNLAGILAAQVRNSGLKIYNYCDKPDLTSREIAEVIANAMEKRLPAYAIPMSIGLLAGGLFDLLAMISGRKFPISMMRIKKFSAETTISTNKLNEDGFAGSHSMNDGIVRMIGSDFSKVKEL
jgi:nucleoside-diphosphate-sugar epimerase